MPTTKTDVFIVGGGVNGVAIARDASGRGLSVRLAEMHDLGSATSSASTKLFHGGLRYLEYFEFNLVRHALEEREVLLRSMPHISWPLRFVLPYRSDMRFDTTTPTSRLLSVFMPWMRGRRPAWLIRLGLFLYDTLGKREILPGTRTRDLHTAVEGQPLQDRYHRAFEYSDCWIEDSRLVSLSARDAAERGADILPRTKVVDAKRDGDGWQVEVEDTVSGARTTYRANVLVNAAGPWVGSLIRDEIGLPSTESVRLVRGSHIVTRKLFDHEKCYFFQGTDGRIIFAIPYEHDFTLIGTTDVEHEGDPKAAVATQEEQDYLRHFVSEYFKTPVEKEDIVWTYSGVRPLYDDGAKSATAATRDYVLSYDDQDAPLLNVFGGKITTHRKLAEEAAEKLCASFPQAKTAWTGGASLPGGDFDVSAFDGMVDALSRHHPYLSPGDARRLVRAYGTDAARMLAAVSDDAGLGHDFGASLREVEVRWLMDHEFAERAEDVVWRRSKLGLRMTKDQIDVLDAWMMTAHADHRLAAAAK